MAPENSLFVQEVAKPITSCGIGALYCNGAAISASRIGKFPVFFPVTRQFEFPEPKVGRTQLPGSAPGGSYPSKSL
jgi:hypothetical protein